MLRGSFGCEGALTGLIPRWRRPWRGSRGIVESPPAQRRWRVSTTLWVFDAAVAPVGVKVVRSDTLIALLRSYARAALPMVQVRV